MQRWTSVGVVLRLRGLRMAAPGLHFWYLPSYSPEFSAIEPIWHAIKLRQMRRRSFELALARKAADLRARHVTTEHFLPLAA